MSNNPNNKERVKARIDVEPVEFQATTEGALMSTITLSKYVNTCMRGVFKDYTGCNIYPVLNDPYSGLHPVRCDLYFSLGSDNATGAKISAFRQIGSGNNNRTAPDRIDYMAMIRDHNARMSSLNCAEITQEAIDCVHPLIYTELVNSIKETAADYRNKTVVKEQTTRVPYSTGEIVTPIITMVDINQIMKLIFNGSVLEKSNYEYSVMPVRNISALGQQGQVYTGKAWGQNFLYQITRLDKDALMDVSNEIGYINRTGNIDCFTESF